LFLIIFVETGVVVMPFLPGDSLLFVVGAMCGVGLMDYPLSVALLIAAAVLGNQSNYTIGRYFGPKVFQWENSRFFNKRAFDQAHAFYEKYGGITIVAARFMPFLRTFAPFVAGVAQMTRSKFTLFDVTGGGLWVGGIVTAGYFFGSMPWVQAAPGQDHLGHDPHPRRAGAVRRALMLSRSLQRDLQHHVFFSQAAGSRGAGVFATVPGVERDDDQAVDARLRDRRRGGGPPQAEVPKPPHAPEREALSSCR
jgi:membrane-associated protein